LRQYDCYFVQDWLPRLLTDIQPIIGSLEYEEFKIKKCTINQWELPSLEIENSDETTFTKKSKPFIMNVMKGGKKFRQEPYYNQPVPYEYV
jgi:hypothetical protein